MAKTEAKIADIRQKTDKELETRLAELRKEQFNLRFQRATGQLANSDRVRQVRKEIARIMSITGERVRGVQAQEGKKAPKAKPAKKSAA